MPRSAPRADPTEIFPFPAGKTPPDDRAYFEMMSWFVFGSGLNYKVVRSKWDKFRRAFDNFDPANVARYTDDDVDRLLSDPGLIRNGKKVAGTVANAREVVGIAKESGGMTPHIRRYRADAPALIKDVRNRFAFMGDTTVRLFLTCAGALEYQTWEPTSRQRTGRR
jgi:DNA-3-methyladenine glycosylase I